MLSSYELAMWLYMKFFDIQRYEYKQFGTTAWNHIWDSNNHYIMKINIIPRKQLILVFFFIIIIF